jgi:hypothetical protein
VKTAKAHQEKRNPQKSKAGSALLFEMKDNKKRKNESKNARKGPENPRKPWTASEGREMSGGVSRELGLRTLQVFSGSYIADFSEPHGQDINRTASPSRGEWENGQDINHLPKQEQRAGRGLRSLCFSWTVVVGWGGVEMERQRSHSSQSPAAALNEAGAPRWARRLLSPLPSSSAPTPLRPTRQRQDSSFLSRLHLAATTYVLGRRVDRAWPTRESGRVQRWAMRPNNGTWSRLLAAQLRTIEKEGAQV